MDTVTLRDQPAPQTLSGQLSLVVFGERLFSTYPLPPEGVLTIGRADNCDVQVMDGSVSRRHAILRIGKELTLEDLGSVNGSRVKSVALAPNQPIAVAPNEVIELGKALLMIQRRPNRPPTIRGLVPEGKMGELQRRVELVADSDITVLILGETGVGKEVLARTVHRMSPRADRPFVPIQCSALASNLFEAELFGHDRGAYTGAYESKPGLLETADGGTVFLDEIGEIVPEMQVKLLRVIQEREVMRVGARRARPINVRFIAATNRNLQEEQAAGRFRKDFFFRLNGMQLTIPPLRERRDEIEGLARAFIAEFCNRQNRAQAALSTDALVLLRDYHWPGNVRELRNVVESAVVLCRGGTIRQEHLRPSMDEALPTLSPARLAALAQPVKPAHPTLPPAPRPEPEPDSTRPVSLRDEQKAHEKARIEEVLRECAGNQTRAADKLGMSRRTFINRMKEFGIPGPRPRGRRAD